MTFYFLNNVFLLDLAFKPAQCIFKRLAFLNANLCQGNYTSRRPLLGNLQSTGNGDKESINAALGKGFRACHVVPFAIFSWSETIAIVTNPSFSGKSGEPGSRFPC